MDFMRLSVLVINRFTLYIVPFQLSTTIFLLSFKFKHFKIV